MANGVIESIYMRSFVEGVISLELPHIYMLFFLILLIFLFLSHALLYFQFPFVRLQAISIAFFLDQGPVITKILELKFGLDFFSTPFL
jgi:hypothetical protein